MEKWPTLSPHSQFFCLPVFHFCQRLLTAVVEFNWRKCECASHNRIFSFSVNLSWHLLAAYNVWFCFDVTIREECRAQTRKRVLFAFIRQCGTKFRWIVWSKNSAFSYSKFFNWTIGYSKQVVITMSVNWSGQFRMANRGESDPKLSA